MFEKKVNSWLYLEANIVSQEIIDCFYSLLIQHVMKVHGANTPEELVETFNAGE
jgi:hypothetical protein